MGDAAQNARIVGRYALYQAIAAGGMATVHLGRLLGPVGFSRTVAIKRLHAQYAADPEFVSMFLDEARLAARIRHPNVVPTLDVVATDGELFLVMEYVPGESLARLARVLRERSEPIPHRILSAVMAGVLHGLHAAHEAKDERGHPLGIVHRDVSPQNVLVGIDGVARVLDFGVAKAAGRMQTTKEGQIKGKLAYMPPEQLRGASVSRQSDIYAVGVMLWETVTGQRLFAGDNEGAIIAKVLEGRIEPPSQVVMRGRPIGDNTVQALAHMDRTILRALDMDPTVRFRSAREMALEIERQWPPATGSEVGDWVERVASEVLNSRAAMVAEIESSASIVVDGTRGRESVLSVLKQAPSAPQSSQTMTETQVASPKARGDILPSIPVEAPTVTQPSSISVSTGHDAAAPDPPANRRAIVFAVFAMLVGAGFFGGALLYRQMADRAAASTMGSDPSPTGVPPKATEPPTATTATTSLSATTASTDSLDASPQATAEETRDAASTTVPSESATASHLSAPPTAVATATVRPPPEIKTRHRPPPPPPPVSHSTTPPPPPNNCSPPYYFDSAGVKRFKPQCL